MKDLTFRDVWLEGLRAGFDTGLKMGEWVAGGQPSPPLFPLSPYDDSPVDSETRVGVVLTILEAAADGDDVYAASVKNVLDEVRQALSLPDVSGD